MGVVSCRGGQSRNGCAMQLLLGTLARLFPHLVSFNGTEVARDHGESIFGVPPYASGVRVMMNSLTGLMTKQLGCSVVSPEQGPLLDGASPCAQRAQQLCAASWGGG